MQYQIPDKKKLNDAFNEIHKQSDRELTKEEFANIIGKVITAESLFFGAAAKGTVLKIFGVPILATLAKRMLPGPTAFISEDVFIPAVTSGTVYILAKTNKL
ncbi:hypothetical protein J5N97_013456 [Dioscorea zingiberensis]|uniref:Uncharacterized protein n=1 Tax=Dioscorea zingiberensis TaxID=325984 RepID=A0A9D5CT11_9LILI|nr:hypothetical protein J5N97_013456 [Dioscorea zingiberensis]